jgi:hypothetical protein
MIKGVLSYLVASQIFFCMHNEVIICIVGTLSLKTYLISRFFIGLF